MMKYDFIIAIDPDVDKSGFAHLDTSTRRMNVANLTFPELWDKLQNISKELQGEKMLVVVEASWMIRGNWHLISGSRQRYAAATGYKVGQNHETGRKIVEMCKHYGIPVMEHAPLRKCWKGQDGKITQGEIEQFIPNFPKRTNQEVRDAALLAWNVANFPIRVTYK